MDPTYEERNKQRAFGIELNKHMSKTMQELHVTKHRYYTYGLVNYDIEIEHATGELLVYPKIELNAIKVPRSILKTVDDLNKYLDLELQTAIQRGLGKLQK